MQEAVLSVAENQFAEIPTELWKQHVKQTAKEIPKGLALSLEQAVYSIPMIQAALFAFR